MKKEALVFLFLIISVLSTGQVIQTIKVDSVTGVFEKQIPFDEPFNICFQGSKYKTLRKVHFYELIKYHYNKEVYIDGRPIVSEKTGYSFFSLDGTNCSPNSKIISSNYDSINGRYSVAEVDKRRRREYDTCFLKSFLLQSVQPEEVNEGVLVRVNPIKAKTSMIEILEYGLNEKQVDSLQKINYAIYSKDTVRINSAQKEYARFTNALNIDFSLYEDRKNEHYLKLLEKPVVGARHPDWCEYNSIYNHYLEDHYRIIHDTTFPKGFYKITNGDLLSHILQLGKQNDVDLNFVYHLHGLDNAQFTEILNGQSQIPYVVTYDTTELSDIEKRMNNLKVSRNYFNQLSDTLRLLETVRNPIDSSKSEINIREKVDSIDTFIGSKWKNLETASKEIKSVLLADTLFTKQSWIENHNDMIDLKTKGSYHLKPTFGIANVLAINNKDKTYLPKLYLGASFYFYPVKHNMPLKYYTNGKSMSLKRLSLNIGLTVGETTLESFKDSFNKVSLLVGLSYDILREFSISIGGTLLQRSDGDTTDENYKFVIMPYLGLALNIDFAHAISKFTGKMYD